MSRIFKILFALLLYPVGLVVMLVTLFMGPGFEIWGHAHNLLIEAIPKLPLFEQKLENLWYKIAPLPPEREPLPLRKIKKKK